LTLVLTTSDSNQRLDRSRASSEKLGDVANGEADGEHERDDAGVVTAHGAAFFEGYAVGYRAAAESRTLDAGVWRVAIGSGARDAQIRLPSRTATGEASGAGRCHRFEYRLSTINRPAR